MKVGFATIAKQNYMHKPVDAFAQSGYEAGIRNEDLPAVEYHFSQGAVKLMGHDCSKYYSSTVSNASASDITALLQSDEVKILSESDVETMFNMLPVDGASVDPQTADEIYDCPVVRAYVVTRDESERLRMPRLAQATFLARDPLPGHELPFSVLSNSGKVLDNLLGYQRTQRYEGHKIAHGKDRGQP
jgi:hypothetical protein